MQPQVKESVSKFMAYVHMSVDDKSKEYLANERRYNYTTPKSFLEQIKLYCSLLGQKSNDLSIKLERLENGLTKLNSTSAQVRYSSPNSKFLISKFYQQTYKHKKKSVKTKVHRMCFRCKRDENTSSAIDRSKYMTSYFSNFPDVFFLHLTSCPARSALC